MATYLPAFSQDVNVQKSICTNFSALLYMLTLLQAFCHVRKEIVCSIKELAGVEQKGKHVQCVPLAQPQETCLKGEYGQLHPIFIWNKIDSIDFSGYVAVCLAGSIRDLFPRKLH